MLLPSPFANAKSRLSFFSSALPHVRHIHVSGRTSEPQSACFLEGREVELSTKHSNAASDTSLIVLRHVYGGPPPFGLGQGLQELEDARSMVPVPPPNKEVEKIQARQLRFELQQTARNFNESIDDLSPGLQAAVMEERLRLTLRKFWDLMHEADRPWHRPLIIRLCCQLPKETRKRYKALKASTLQYTIADRSKVEKEIHQAHDTATFVQKKVAALLKQERLTGIPKTAALEECIQQVQDMRTDMGRVKSNAAQLRRLAWNSFLDEDYIQYNQRYIEPIADRLQTWASEFLVGIENSMLEGKSISSDSLGVTERKVRSGMKKGGMTSAMLLQQDWIRVLPLEQYEEWPCRYPPRLYLRAKAKPVGLSRGEFTARVLEEIDVPVFNVSDYSVAQGSGAGKDGWGGVDNDVDWFLQLDMSTSDDDDDDWLGS